MFFCSEIQCCLRSNKENVTNLNHAQYWVRTPLSLLYVLQLLFTTKGANMVNVQAQCMAAVAEGSTNPVTLKLSKLGATGKRTNNIERDFGNWVKKFVSQQRSILQCFFSKTHDGCNT